MKLNSYADFLNCIRDAVSERGLSQYELADKVGVSPSAVCCWLSGKRSVSVNQGLKILKACGKSLRIE